MNAQYKSGYIVTRTEDTIFLEIRVPPAFQTAFIYHFSRDEVQTKDSTGHKNSYDSTEVIAYGYLRDSAKVIYRLVPTKNGRRGFLRLWIESVLAKVYIDQQNNSNQQLYSFNDTSGHWLFLNNYNSGSRVQDAITEFYRVDPETKSKIEKLFFNHFILQKDIERAIKIVNGLDQK